MITKESISGALAQNAAWTTGNPIYKNMDFWESKEKFALKKTITEKMILKDLLALEYEEREKTGNNQFAILVAQMITRELTVANWQNAEPFAIWKSIFQKACGRARKALYGKTDLESLSKGILKNGKENTRPIAEQQRVSGTSPGFRSGTSRFGSHDALEGRR